MTQPTVSEFVNDWFDTHRAEIIGWRRHIHSHPEPSNQEFETTKYLAKVLAEYGLDVQRFPETGLMVDIGPDTEEGQIGRASCRERVKSTEVEVWEKKKE